MFVCRFLVLFGLAQSPLAAAVAYAGITGGHCFRGSGASANYYEVGGRDTAMINAVRENGIFEPFIYNNEHFAKTGSGQT